MAKPENVRVGFWSRIDYCAPGFRENLVKRMRKVFEDEDTAFDVLIGGLISRDGLKQRIKTAFTDSAEKEKIRVQDLKARGKKGVVKQPVNRKAITEQVINEVVEELSEIIPKRKRPNSKKLVRLYVMTSPAYDGPYGPEIASRLAEKRPEDIRHWANSHEHLPLVPSPHPSFKEIACLVPTAQVFRSRYDSTPVDRVVEDYFGLATRVPADTLTVGCYGSHFYQPKGGSSSRPYTSTPNSHRPERNRASENQIGVIVHEYTTEGDLLVRNHSFNDLVVRERKSINISPQYTRLQRKIMDEFRDRTWATDRTLSDHLNMSREDITRILKDIVDTKRLRPPLKYDKTSGRYFIPRSWIQANLTYDYAWPSPGLTEERILSFCCMHAFCRDTVHEYMTTEVPRRILQHGVTTLVGAGDFIEGLEHDLDKKGEIIAGADYTKQEETAAHLVGEAMLRVFENRFSQKLATLKKSELKADDALSLVKSALLQFSYIPGNHDEWLKRKGIKALKTFRNELLKFLRLGITAIISREGLPLPILDDSLEAKVIVGNKQTLPTGISMGLQHLHMARASTKSLRSQSILDNSDNPVDIHGNFHTAIALNRYNPEIGQRVIQQVGTLKVRSEFEDRKGKKVDFGVWYLRIVMKNKRIVLTESAHFSMDNPDGYKGFDNDSIFKDFEKKIGIREL